MTRSETFGIVVGYADLPASLARAAASIIGNTTGLEVVENPDLPQDVVDRLLEQALSRHPGARFIVFVDMYGSSCAHAATRLWRKHQDIELVCGVSLPLLVRFLQHREGLGFTELVELLRRTGQEQTCSVPN